MRKKIQQERKSKQKVGERDKVHVKRKGKRGKYGLSKAVKDREQQERKRQIKREKRDRERKFSRESERERERKSKTTC